MYAPLLSVETHCEKTLPKVPITLLPLTLTLPFTPVPNSDLTLFLPSPSYHHPLGGAYYALHIRRGDFQYKDVKLSADEIVANLRFDNKTPIIPPGAMVYLSTDDPKVV